MILILIIDPNKYYYNIKIKFKSKLSLKLFFVKYKLYTHVKYLYILNIKQTYS